MDAFKPDQQTYLINRFEEACEYHENGEYAKAEELYRRLLKKHPDLWIIHYNLGLLLFDKCQFEQALISYRKAYNNNRSSNDILYNMAICQKACGQYDDAIISYQQALDLDPDDLDSLYNLCGCYRQKEENTSAIECYKKLLAQKPDHQSSLNNLAFMYHKAGDFAQARNYYTALLEINPDHQAADYMLAAINGDSRITAPASYVRELFDNYSGHYEESLVSRLGYDLPETLLMVLQTISSELIFKNVIDLGCGTGLAGQVFNKMTNQLHGVDLSTRMLEIAETKNVYSTLTAGDVYATVSQLPPARYDLIIAADVFTYIGDLAELFFQCHRVSENKGLFLFSVEDLPVQKKQILLRESGRFAHSNTYINNIAAESGWYILDSRIINLRKEKDTWIKGAIYAMSKR